jgi:copper chaperone CopZ
MERTLAVKGMHCQNCADKLTRKLAQVPGVTAAHVSLAPPQAHLTTAVDVPLSSLQSAATSAGGYTLLDGAAATPAEALKGPDLHRDPTAPVDKPASLYPLILIVAYILGTVGLTTFFRADHSWRTFMYDFMGAFFLVFSFFKLLDPRGFADAYSSYDIIARSLRPWAFAYPWIELALAIAYLARWNPPITNSVTLALMLIGSAGVLLALIKKDAIRCACLGTALNLPMTTVTLLEDLGMAAMAGAMLGWDH